MAAEAAGSRLTGAVKTFNGQWGFVSSPDYEGDIFVHLRDSPSLTGPALRPGETVDFDLVFRAGGKHNGAQAVNVVRASAFADGLPGGDGQQCVGEQGGEQGSGEFTPQGQQQYAGPVIHFRQDKGWGLVECASLDDPKLFFGIKDNPQLSGLGLAAGDEIAFDIGANNEGRPRAENAELILRPLDQLVGRRVRGVVKNFRDGWGFACSDRFEGDVLLGRANMAQAGLSFQVSAGDVIEFEVAAGTGGQRFQAVAPQLMSQASPQMMQPTGMGGHLPLIMQMRGPPGLRNGGRAADRSRTPPPMAHTPLAVRQFGLPQPGITPRPGRILSGVIASFKGDWGLVEAPSLPEKLFFGLRDNPQLEGFDTSPGQPVQFEVGTNPKNGRARAMNMSIGGSGGGVSPQSGPPAWAAPPAKPSRVGGGGGGGGGAQPGGRVQGIVKSFRDGWGFASSQDCEGDVLLGRKTLQQEGLTHHLAQGDAVEFELHAGSNGRWQAASVRKL